MQICNQKNPRVKINKGLVFEVDTSFCTQLINFSLGPNDELDLSTKGNWSYFDSLEVTRKEFTSTFHTSDEKFVKFSNFGFNNANSKW